MGETSLSGHTAGLGIYDVTERLQDALWELGIFQSHPITSFVFLYLSHEGKK